MGQGQPKPPAQPPKDHAKDATDKNAADKLTTDKLLQDAPPKDENKDLKDTVYPDLPDPLADPQGLGRLNGSSSRRSSSTVPMTGEPPAPPSTPRSSKT